MHLARFQFWNMNIKTIKELQEWIITKNIPNYISSFDGSVANEGMGIDNWGGLFIWYYSERGNRENLQYFRTEAEIVAFAFDYINDLLQGKIR